MKGLVLKSEEIEFLEKLAVEAGQLILNVRKFNLKICKKKDSSPVTNADIESNNLITKKLKKKFPSIPIISEESPKKKMNQNFFFLVDPLDGTKEFVRGSNEFTVNIALIFNGSPEYGFINIPALQKTYYNNQFFSYCKVGKRASFKIISNKKTNEYVAELSRSHFNKDTKSFLDLLKIKNKNFSGSSIKICKIADGSSNIYPRFSSTMEWDIAAGHSILKRAGGEIFNVDGSILNYKKKKYKNSSFIALGTKLISHKIKKILRNFQ